MNVRFFRKKDVTRKERLNGKDPNDEERTIIPTSEEVKNESVSIKSVCDLCGRKGGIDGRLEFTTIEGKELLLHPGCMLTKKLEAEQVQNQELEKNMKDLRQIEKQEKHLQVFQNISYNLNSELEAILVFEYSDPTQSKTRLFFSKENSNTLFSREYLTNTTDNVIHLKIKPDTHRNAKMISGGNYDFNDSFDDGYTLVLNFKYSDQSLRKEIIDILKKERFGCLPADFTIHAHLNRSTPNESDAKEILARIIGRIRERISPT